MKQKEQVKEAGIFYLGDEASEAIIDQAQTDDSRMKLDNDKGSNIYALISNQCRAVWEHWFDIDGQRRMYPCGVHQFTDDKRVAEGFAPDECPFCNTVLRLYQEPKQDLENSLNEKKRKIAKDLRAGLGYIFLAIKGEADMKRVGGKRIVEPFFENFNVGKLYLTKSSFEMLRSEFRAIGFVGKDAERLPINFERGKKNAKATFSQVIKIEFFPDFKILAKDIPKNIPDLTGMVNYDPAVAKELFDKWVIECAKLLSDKSSSKRKRK